MVDQQFRLGIACVSPLQLRCVLHAVAQSSLGMRVMLRAWSQDDSLQSASWVRERRSVNAADRAERAAAAAERAAAVAQRAAVSARRPTASEPRPYYRRVRQHLEAGCGVSPFNILLLSEVALSATKSVCSIALLLLLLSAFITVGH
jgi:hypothetical protein